MRAALFVSVKNSNTAGLGGGDGASKEHDTWLTTCQSAKYLFGLDPWA